jgi:hypothetical protein
MMILVDQSDIFGVHSSYGYQPLSLSEKRALGRGCRINHNSNSLNTRMRYASKTIKSLSNLQAALSKSTNASIIYTE